MRGERFVRRLLIGLILAGAWLGRSAGAADQGAAPAAAPIYFDRAIKDEDLATLSLPDLALMRNTIYAHAGRRFRSPELQTLFAKQPWYAPKAPSVVKLTPRDRGNLRAIVGRERQIRFRDVVAPCPGASATTWTLDASQQSQLQEAEGGLDWPPGYGNTGDCRRSVKVMCGPDLDGDGAPEFIIRAEWLLRLNGEEGCDPDRDTNYWRVTHLFLATRKDGRWVGIGPLSEASDEFPGTEIGAYFVRRSNGRLAVYVSNSGYSSDDERRSSGFEILDLQKGKLRKVAQGAESDP